jgi:hypothetical protein
MFVCESDESSQAVDTTGSKKRFGVDSHRFSVQGRLF